MNNIFNEDRFIFKILFFTCYISGIALELFDPYEVSTYEYSILGFFCIILPILFLIRKERIYVYIFCLYIIILEFLFYIINERVYIFINGMPNLIFLWQIIIILLITEIYFGFKIMIREFLAYRKMSLEERKKEKTIDAIMQRAMYFFLCLILIIFSFFVSSYIFDEIYLHSID